MLESMRQNVKSLKVFLWLVIAAFIGTIFLVWGQGGRTGGVVSQDAVAWVNDAAISASSFENSYRNIYAFYKQMYGENLSDDALKSLQLEQVALNQLTQRELLIQEAERHDLRVSDEELITTIQAIPQFQRNNRFDSELYKQALARVRMTPQEFEEQTSSSLLAEKIEHLIKQTAMVTEQEALEDYTAKNEKVEVEGLVVKAGMFTDAAEFSEEDVQTYYNLHKERFTTPERVKVQYLHFDPQQLKEELTPTDEEIREYYNAHESEFDKGKEVSARHILFRLTEDADEETVNRITAKAEEALREIKDGADFAELAKERSEDTVSGKEGGDLGFFTKGMMIPEFEEAAFNLEPGQISEPVRTQFGLHLIKVEAVREEEDPYGKATPQIIDRLKLAGAKEAAAERAEISYEDLLDTDNLAEVAQKDAMEIQVSDFFAKGEPIDAQTIALPQLQDAAFLLDAQQKFSQPLTTTSGDTYILEFLELKEPYIPELEEIREKVEAAVRQEKSLEMARAEIDRIKEALTSGTVEWAALAGSEGYTAETMTPRPFNRRQKYLAEVRSAPEEFVTMAFGLEQGEYSDVIELSDDSYGIVRLKARIASDMAGFEKEKEALQQELLGQKQDTLFREFIEELRQKADIRIKDGLFS